MNYGIDPDVFKLVPDFLRVVLVVSGADNASDASDFVSVFRAMLASSADNPDLSIDDERIRVWGELYRKFPLPRGEKIRPSHETLVRRIKRGDAERIPFISPLVAVSNLTALTHLVPSGVFDRSQIRGDLSLTFATGSESFQAFGKDAPEPVIAGELVLKDMGQDTVVCRAWNSKGGVQSSIASTTVDAVVDIDILTRIISEQEIEATILEAASLIRTYCGASVQTFRLSPHCTDIVV